MDVAVIKDSDALNDALAQLFVWAESVDMAYAWAGSGDGKARHWLALDIRKIKRAAIGIAFAGSEPQALRALHTGADRLRIVQRNGGTYHPKVVLGRRGRQCRAIVGSANLTSGAYTGNTELCLVLEGDVDDAQIIALDEFISDQWCGGVPLDLDWLPEYEKSFKRARTKKDEIRVPPLPPQSPALSTLAMTWDEYVEKIRAQDNRRLVNGYRIQTTHGQQSYFWELDQAAKLFRKQGGFAQRTREQRTFLMGMGDSTGLLGRMGGAGAAMSIAQNNPAKLAAIDSLPKSGGLSLMQVRRLLDGLTKPKGVGLGVATRLMAAKRPDLFVSVNQGSEPQLADARGGRGIKSIVQYVKFIGEVWSTEWHQSARPLDAAEGAMWDRRGALLDAALYQHVDPR